MGSSSALGCTLSAHLESSAGVSDPPGGMASPRRGPLGQQQDCLLLSISLSPYVSCSKRSLLVLLQPPPSGHAPQRPGSQSEGASLLARHPSHPYPEGSCSVGFWRALRLPQPYQISRRRSMGREKREEALAGLPWGHKQVPGPKHGWDPAYKIPNPWSSHFLLQYTHLGAVDEGGDGSLQHLREVTEPRLVS